MSNSIFADISLSPLNQVTAKNGSSFYAGSLALNLLKSIRCEQCDKERGYSNHRFLEPHSSSDTAYSSASSSYSSSSSSPFQKTLTISSLSTSENDSSINDLQNLVVDLSMTDYRPMIRESQLKLQSLHGVSAETLESAITIGHRRIATRTSFLLHTLRGECELAPDGSRFPLFGNGMLQRKQNTNRGVISTFFD